jgi:hypothetical protein
MAASPSMRALVLERHNGPFVLRPYDLTKPVECCTDGAGVCILRKKQEMLGVRFQ